MQDRTAKKGTLIDRFIKPGPLFLFVLSLLLGVSALILWVYRYDLKHPGTLIAALVLMAVTLIFGLITVLLQPYNGGLPLPSIIGVEVLVKRWLELENLTIKDSVCIYRQLLIAQEIFAQNNIHTITLKKYFSGGKPEKSAILVQPSGMRLQVLKFDNVDNIRKEFECYDNYVAGRIGIHTPGRPIDYWIIREANEGAIRYEFAQRIPDASLMTFGQYCKEKNINTSSVEQALNEILRIMDLLWQRPDDTNPQYDSLYDEYERLRRNFPKIKGTEGTEGFNKIQDCFANHIEISNDHKHFYLKDNGWESDSLRNPLDWVDKVFRKDKYLFFDNICGDLDPLINNSSTIVHGDFHSGNILVEEVAGTSPTIWIIDFPHTHIGSTVQDIARLEADIKFDLPPDDNLKTLGIRNIYKFEKVLLAPWSDANTFNQQCPINEEYLEKVWTIVYRLHSRVLDRVMGGNVSFYYLALLHATLPVLYYRDRSPWQKLYAFISAALLCERLGG